MKKIVEVKESSELKDYCKSTGISAFLLIFCLFWVAVCSWGISRDNVFNLKDITDWLWLVVILTLVRPIYSSLREDVPIWWKRYWHRPVLFCQYYKEIQIFSFIIISRRDAKRAMKDLAISNARIRIMLPLYGWWNFAWGKMTWHNGRGDCTYQVRLQTISMNQTCLAPDAACTVDVCDGSSRLSNISLHWLPVLAVMNSNESLAEIVTVLALSQMQSKETVKEISGLKTTSGKYRTALVKIVAQAQKGLEIVNESTRFQISNEAGEVGEKCDTILELANEAEKELLDESAWKARIAWSGSEIQQRLERRRALKEQDEERAEEGKRGIPRRDYKRRRLAREPK